MSPFGIKHEAEILQCLELSETKLVHKHFSYHPCSFINSLLLLILSLSNELEFVVKAIKTAIYSLSSRVGHLFYRAHKQLI